MKDLRQMLCQSLCQISVPGFMPDHYAKCYAGAMLDYMPGQMPGGDVTDHMPGLCKIRFKVTYISMQDDMPDLCPNMCQNNMPGYMTDLRQMLLYSMPDDMPGYLYARLICQVACQITCRVICQIIMPNVMPADDRLYGTPHARFMPCYMPEQYAR